MRLLLVATGVAVIGYGGWLVLTTVPPHRWLAVVLWLVAGVVVHDAVIAPASLGVGWALDRWGAATAGRRTARDAIGRGLLLIGSLTLVAVPVLGGWGRRPDNPTLLDRDYVGGWLGVVALVVLGLGARTLVVLERVSRVSALGSRRTATGGDDGAGAGGGR